MPTELTMFLSFYFFLQRSSPLFSSHSVWRLGFSFGGSRIIIITLMNDA